MGWFQMPVKVSGGDAEDHIIDYLRLRDFAVVEGGSRHQSFDLQIVESAFPTRKFVDNCEVPEILPGKYEVKALYRKNENCSFDRRFKTGTRGETIYGRRDAETKALALDIENYLDHGIGGGAQFIQQMHGLVDDALARRHGKEFSQRFTLAAEVYSDLYMLSSADVYLQGGLSGLDIQRGFSDIDGIFILAGEYFTLVRRDEFPVLLEFDSVSVEGVKLRYIGSVPK